MTVGTISITVGLILLVLLILLFKDDEVSSQNKGFHGINSEELFKEDLEYDPSWATLSSNTHHSEDD